MRKNMNCKPNKKSTLKSSKVVSSNYFSVNILINNAITKKYNSDNNKINIFQIMNNMSRRVK